MLKGRSERESIEDRTRAFAIAQAFHAPEELEKTYPAPAAKTRDDGYVTEQWW